ncbi:MAG: holo-ACP synthase [Ignavibacteria bacterium]|jgi:holo-[acyl-carrier protein] synthase
MIRGIGVDIIDIKRVKRIIDQFGDRFFEKILTEKEIAYCKSFSKPDLHFAGRFAAKEAYSKSIGTGISKSFGWRDIEILNDEKGKPYIRHTKKNDYSFLIFNISISHTDEYACAMVTCEE